MCKLYSSKTKEIGNISSLYITKNLCDNTLGAELILGKIGLGKHTVGGSCGRAQPGKEAIPW